MQLPELVPVLFAGVLSSRLYSQVSIFCWAVIFFSIFLPTSKSTIIAIILLIFFCLVVYFLSSFCSMRFACSSVLYLNPRTESWRRWDRECLDSRIRVSFWMPWGQLYMLVCAEYWCSIKQRSPEAEPCCRLVASFTCCQSCNNNVSCFFWNNQMCFFCLLETHLELTLSKFAELCCSIKNVCKTSWFSLFFFSLFGLCVF